MGCVAPRHDRVGKRVALVGIGRRDGAQADGGVRTVLILRQAEDELVRAERGFRIDDLRIRRVAVGSARSRRACARAAARTPRARRTPTACAARVAVLGAIDLAEAAGVDASVALAVLLDRRSLLRTRQGELEAGVLPQLVDTIVFAFRDRVGVSIRVDRQEVAGVVEFEYPAVRKGDENHALHDRDLDATDPVHLHDEGRAPNSDGAQHRSHADAVRGCFADLPRDGGQQTPKDGNGTGAQVGRRVVDELVEHQPPVRGQGHHGVVRQLDAQRAARPGFDQTVLEDGIAWQQADFGSAGNRRGSDAVDERHLADRHAETRAGQRRANVGELGHEVAGNAGHAVLRQGRRRRLGEVALDDDNVVAVLTGQRQIVCRSFVVGAEQNGIARHVHHRVCSRNHDRCHRLASCNMLDDCTTLRMTPLVEVYTRAHPAACAKCAPGWRRCPDFTSWSSPWCRPCRRTDSWPASRCFAHAPDGS